jgi:hypothetical protein
MKNILGYLNPLWVFIGGMIVTLFATLFFPIIGDAATSGILAHPSVDHYWGLRQVASGSRLLIFVICFGCTVYLTIQTWFARKS